MMHFSPDSDSADSNGQVAWSMLIGCGTGDLTVHFLFSGPAFAVFLLFFLIFSYKSPRAPHISHSTCFPGSFQIRGSEDSLGGSGRALSPYPSPYLETSDEKDFGRKLIIVAFLCGSKW